MTVGEAIRKARSLRHAAMSEESGMYYKWLTEIEQEIAEHLNRHVDPAWVPSDQEGFDPLNMAHPPGGEPEGDWAEAPEYTEADTETEMLLPVRWEMIYVYKLMCEIDMTVGETEQYNKDATLYNQMMAEWKAWVRRTMRPKADHRRGWKLV